VTAINHETREVTLESETGEVLEIVAGDDVRNLGQVEVGDVVDVEYFEALALALQETRTGVQERKETIDTNRAEPGEKPGGVVSRRIEVLAKVIEVDKENRLVILQGPDGIATLKVGDDVDLTNIDMDDEVKAVYMEEVAISVRSPE
jgi:hypothetical protein